MSMARLSSKRFTQKRMCIIIYTVQDISNNIFVSENQFMEFGFFYSFNRCRSQKEIRLRETPYCWWKCMHTVSEVENLKPLCTQRVGRKETAPEL